MKKFFVSLFLLSGIVLSLNAQTIVTSDQSVSRTLPTWRIAIQAGGALRLGSVPNEYDSAMKDYTKKLKRGISYGADVTWFFSESLGAGLKFNSYRSAAKMDVVAQLDGNLEAGVMEDNISILFLGPTFSTRLVSASGKHAFFTTLGCGYMGFKDTGKVIIPVALDGCTFGCVGEIAYDYSLTEHFAIGASLAYYSGILKEYTTTMAGTSTRIELSKDKRESLAHLDLSIGVRFNL